MQAPGPSLDGVFDNCWVAGWGRDGSGTLPTRLQELQVQVEADITVCAASGWGSGIFTANHLCATRADGTGICHGDSGGPLMCKWGDKQWVLHT
ncbi:chymotrypsin-like elastase family member 2B [Amphiura filiformis]|uniref:chymotrypsin-like elastase family member 2B n=1 Tax=Amphiura filiformis TaxID=82378 RepID=UPI003B21B107